MTNSQLKRRGHKIITQACKVIQTEYLDTYGGIFRILHSFLQYLVSRALDLLSRALDLVSRALD